MIFLTVGSTRIQYERLVRAIDEAIIDGIIKDDVYGQIGASHYRPRHMKYTDYLDKEKFDRILKEADLVISHAGIGTIKMALDNNKKFLAVPRLKEYNELVNDHQVSTAKKFEVLGHIVCLYNLSDKILLAQKIDEAKAFIRKERISKADDLAEDILYYISTL